MTTRAAQGQHLDRGLLTVAQAGEYLGTGERFVRRLITEASHRTVTLPAAIAAVLKDHLEKHVAAAPDTLLFSTSSGGYLARSNWNSTFRRTADAIGLPAIRPHELRHTGATLAAATGATTKELMRRLGHSSPQPRCSISTQRTTTMPRSRALDVMLGAARESSDDDPEWND
jgi:integrase